MSKSNSDRVSSIPQSGDPTDPSVAKAIRETIESRLLKIYDQVEPAVIDTVVAELQTFASQRNAAQSWRRFKEDWDEKDVVLITYADQIQEPDRPALSTLHKFLVDRNVPEFVNIVHLLPFYPWSSDDGFSVIDYRDLAPGVGTWDDVAAMHEDVDLMFDLVLNHCSQQHDWFKRFLLDEEPYNDFFVTADPAEDLSQVTRPRSHRLLSEFETAAGPRHVWTTFSRDQVDLNFANPAVLIEFLRILMFYVRSGARIIRLDAIAFLWKKIGTSCVHLKQTHEVVKLMRDVLDIVAPDVILLTETNVPHRENVSYFGKGDEARMVYQFSLPPLLLDALIHEDPTHLRQWLLDLDETPPGTTFFNFTASHDGIGVRPLEGLLPDERFESLIQEMKRRGAYVSTRRKPDGSEVPYELNITYRNALSTPPSSTESNADHVDLDIRRFMASQAVMVALPGIPGIYFHSLVGTPNDSQGAEESKIPRRINRRKYRFDELSQMLDNAGHEQTQVFQRYENLLSVRTDCAAFHPEAALEVLDVGNERLFAFQRTSLDGNDLVKVILNPTLDDQDFALGAGGRWADLLEDRSYASADSVKACSCIWLKTAAQ